jgi:Ni,Fe-hydrogenase III small subunit
MDCVKKIAEVPTDINERPRIPVHITDCGLDTDEDSEEEEVAQSIEEVKETEEEVPAVSGRRAEIMMRVNQALKLNNKAVIDEQMRLNDPNYERKKNQETLYSEKQKEAEGTKAHLLITANAHQKG